MKLYASVNIFNKVYQLCLCCCHTHKFLLEPGCWLPVRAIHEWLNESNGQVWNSGIFLVVYFQSSLTSNIWLFPSPGSPTISMCGSPRTGMLFLSVCFCLPPNKTKARAAFTSCGHTGIASFRLDRVNFKQSVTIAYWHINMEHRILTKSRF